MKYDRRGNELPLHNLFFMHHHNHYSYRRFMPFLFLLRLSRNIFFFADADAVVYHTVYGSLRYHNFVSNNIVKQIYPVMGASKRQTLYSLVSYSEYGTFFFSVRRRNLLNHKIDEMAHHQSGELTNHKHIFFYFMRLNLFMILC